VARLRGSSNRIPANPELILTVRGKPAILPSGRVEPVGTATT